MKKKVFGRAYCLCLLASILFSVSAFAATIKVPANQPTIQAGIDAASNGDTVNVAAGTYSGTGNTNISFKGKIIKVVSADATKCIVDCQGSGTGFIFESGETGSAVLAGFSIINGAEGGIHLSGASPTIRNCIIRNNAGVDTPGGISAVNSNSLIIGCGIANNVALNGGAIRASYSKLRLKNCVIAFNRAEQAGGAISATYSGVNILNCTIVSNTSAQDSGGALYGVKSPQVVIKNSILWLNTFPSIVSDNVADYSVTYSDLSDVFVGDGNIFSAPKFTKMSAGDFRLLAGSPCIDAGTNDANGLPPTDIIGAPRVVDGNGDGQAIVDMGAYEFQALP